MMVHALSLGALASVVALSSATGNEQAARPPGVGRAMRKTPGLQLKAEHDVAPRSYWRFENASDPWTDMQGD